MKKIFIKSLTLILLIFGMINNIEAQITTEPVDDEICNGNNAGFSVEPIDANQYQWQLSDNSSGPWTNLEEEDPFQNVTSYQLTIVTPDPLYRLKFFRCRVRIGGTWYESVPVQIIILTLADFEHEGQCEGSEIQFTDLSIVENGSLTWTWDFDDGSISFSQNPTNTYSSDGDYDVSLSIISDNGCNDVITKTVTIYQQPEVNFSFTTECLGDLTQFTDESNVSIGSITDWYWDFGDEGTSTIQNPTHEYTSSGTYNVKLVVTSSSGCMDSISQPIVVHPLPEAEFIFTTECLGIATEFTDESSVSIGSITDWDWDFGDEGASTTQNPTHEYTSSGTYNVKLVVTSSNGCLDSISQSIVVYPLPEAEFTFTTECLGIATEFTDESNVSSGSISEWYWDFGDEGTSTTQNPTHEYTSSGTYNVKLVVTSNNGCLDSISQIVTVYSLPTTTIFGDATICDDGSTTPITVDLTGSQPWNITYQLNGSNDVTVENITSSPYTFYVSVAGIYTISEVSDSNCDGTMSGSATIILVFQPIVEAGTNATICETENYVLNEADSMYCESIEWSTFGDGSFDDVNVLYATYNPGEIDKEDGFVTLALTGNAISPCSDNNESSMTLSIINTPSPYAGNDTTICENGTFQLEGDVICSDLYYWSSSGDGLFDDTTILDAIYTPGLDDIVSGSVELFLNAFGTNDSTHSFILSIQKLPVAYAGEDAIVCTGDVYSIIDANTIYSDAYEWTTVGDGEFDNPTIVNPEYTPGPQDYSNGSVTLLLTAIATNPCLVDSIDSMILSFQVSPSSNAGSNDEICEDDAYQIIGASVSENDGLLWSTDGDGYFDDVNKLDAIYYHGAGDVNNGYVTITLAALATLPCTENAESSITLTINPAPLAPVSGIDNLCANSHWVEYTANILNFNQEWTVENGAIDSIWQGGCIVNWDDLPLNTGVVNLTTTDISTGCEKNNLMNVQFSEFSALNPTQIVEKPRRENGVPVVLICTDSGYVYQWYKNYEPINSEAGQFYYPGSNDEIEPGVVYQVSVENEYKCQTMSYKYTYLPDKSLLFNQSDIFIIFPNPAKDYFTINLNEQSISKDFEFYEILVIDITGQITYKNKIFEVVREIAIPNIESGLYFVQINLPGNQLQVKKLIIE